MTSMAIVLHTVLSTTEGLHVIPCSWPHGDRPAPHHKGHGDLGCTCAPSPAPLPVSAHRCCTSSLATSSRAGPPLCLPHPPLAHSQLHLQGATKELTVSPNAPHPADMAGSKSEKTAPSGISQPHPHPPAARTALPHPHPISTLVDSRQILEGQLFHTPSPLKPLSFYPSAWPPRSLQTCLS